MRHLHQPLEWGTAGFTHWPEGRGYARFLLEQLQAAPQPRSGETNARIAATYLLLTEGEEATPPQQRERYRQILDDVSVVRKEGPWVVGLSGQCSPGWEDNQFVLDRQAAISLWHEEAGLVLDGSNSKFQPELATFHRPGETTDHLPQRAELLSGATDEEVISLHYHGYTATVAVTLLDRQAAALRLAATGQGGCDVIATLVPHISYGETCMVGGWAKYY